MSLLQTELLYGIHPVFEALRAGRRKIFEIYLAKEENIKRLEKIVQGAEALKIPIKRVKASQLDFLAGNEQHQGVGAKTSLYPLAGISEVIHEVEAGDANFFLLLLDNVLDPHNLGALARTALCVGINGIVIPKDRSASPTPAVSKASAGALEHIRLVRVTNMVNFIKELKAKGLWIVGLDVAADMFIYSSDLTGSLALVIGGEEKGLRPLVKKHCDFLVSIPQTGRIDSLNASVAGAVAMYEAFRQRSLPK